jgi:hypothetical protein
MSLSASISYFAKKRPFVIIKERTASFTSSVRFKSIATMPQKRALEDYPLAAKGPLECALEVCFSKSAEVDYIALTVI